MYRSVTILRRSPARDRARAAGILALLLTLCLSESVPAAAQQEDLRVLQDRSSGVWMRYTDAPNALYQHLRKEATHLLERRARAVAALRTAEDWRRRQEWVRETLLAIVRPFPERMPLRPRITGRLEKDGYRVEKLIFESQPGFPVTAALFLPGHRTGPAPAILYLSGHSTPAFRNPAYQTVILNLVRKGFVVLAIDPVGQGERLQYFDPAVGQSRIGGNTLEHSYPGAQHFIAGGSLAREMTWDGIRSIDYLITRPEVDPQRIGVTGRSGGGTQAAYVAALDERVRAVAIENYLTSFRRLWETRGPGDAEQNLFHGIASGLDHVDLLTARAPRPTLVVATTRDYMSIQGTRETFAEAKRAYAALGAEEALQLVEDDARHESTRANREALYAFFQRELGLPGDPSDEAVELLGEAELQVTPTGQVVTSFEAETLFDLGRELAGTRLAGLERSRQRGASHVENAVTAARRLSGYRAPAEPGEVLFMGRYQRAGYAVEKYLVDGEGEYPIPFLLLLPDGEGPHPAVVYLHPQGKAAEAETGGEMEWLVRLGYAVVAPDLVGTGEMGPGAFRGDSYNFRVGPAPYTLWFGSVLVGRSFVGVQAGDLVRVFRMLQQRADIEAECIYGLARKEMTPVLLHAAAFESALAGVALVEPLLSYAAVVSTEFYHTGFVPAAVAGALTAYDLQDLAAGLAPRRLLVIDPLGGDARPAGAEQVERELEVVRASYAREGAAERLWVQRSSPDGVRDALSRWLAPAHSALPAGQSRQVDSR